MSGTGFAPMMPMTRATRDLVGKIINNPWWIVVGVCVSGAIWGTKLQGEVSEVQAKVYPIADLRQQVDSLRIEQRHIGEDVREIRHLLGRKMGQAGDEDNFQPLRGTP
jgi:hypothetical protein